MGQLSKREKTKRRKNSRPRPKPAQVANAVTREVVARANELQLPIGDFVERAFRAAPEPDILPSTMLKQHMLKNPRVFLWAMEHFFGKPGQQLEASGAGRGPMEIKVVIETIGGEE